MTLSCGGSWLLQGTRDTHEPGGGASCTGPAAEASSPHLRDGKTDSSQPGPHTPSHGREERGSCSGVEATLPPGDTLLSPAGDQQVPASLPGAPRFRGR